VPVTVAGADLKKLSGGLPQASSTIFDQREVHRGQCSPTAAPVLVPKDIPGNNPGDALPGTLS